MLDRNQPTPLYLQLDRILRENIRSGEWKANALIPSENELSRTYGLSRMTVRSVLTTLVKEGLLYRVQGKGTFVAEPKIAAKSPAYLGLRDQLEAQGYQITTKVLSIETRRAGEHAAARLEIDPETPVCYIKRIRYAGEEPLSLNCSYLPLAFCDSLAKEDFKAHTQLCHLLEERFGLKTESVSETLEAILPTEDEAQLLSIPSHTPLLALEDRIRDKKGICFEYSRILFRGDKIKLHFER